MISILNWLNPAQLVFLVVAVVTYTIVTVGGHCLESELTDELNYTVPQIKGSYCFVDECSIRIIDSNVLLNIINNTGDWIMATNTTNLFVAPSNGRNCASEVSPGNPEFGYFIFFVVIRFIIVITGFSNILLHVIVKELRTVPGMIIIGISGATVFTSGFAFVSTVFQYVQRVNENTSICVSLKYIVIAFTLLGAIIKVMYLFHFGYLVYRSFKLLPQRENDWKLLYLYGVILIGLVILCISVVITTDVTHEKTAFETRNGYCVEFFHNPGMSDKVLISMLALLTVMEIIFFIVAITLYYLATKQFCTCGTGPSYVRVAITLISAIGLNASLLVILLLAGVEGESSTVAVAIATCVEQVTLLFVFLTSEKVRTKIQKYLEKRHTNVDDKSMPFLVLRTAKN